MRSELIFTLATASKTHSCFAIWSHLQPARSSRGDGMPETINKTLRIVHTTDGHHAEPLPKAV